VERGLGDEAVGERESQHAGHAGRQAEEEDVPVEAGRFGEGELGALGYEGGYWEESVQADERRDVEVTVMVEPEEDG
jgi:hypothetical protein